MAQSNNNSGTQALNRQAISAVPGAYRVGDKVTDASGTEWVVSRIWDWPNWKDLDLYNTKTGAWGSLRHHTVHGLPKYSPENNNRLSDAPSGPPAEGAQS